jgi:hypothetical protein
MKLSDFQWLIKGFVSDFPLMCKIKRVPLNRYLSRVPHKRHHHMHKVYDCEASTRQPITSTAVDGISSIGRIAFPFTQQGQHA